MWKIGFFSLLAIIVIGANIFVWYFFVQGKPVPTPTSTTQITATPPQTQETVPSSTVDEASLIKQAIFKLTGLDSASAEVTINKNTGKHAKGTIKEYEAVGGAYWIAAKTAAGWVGVYAGQATPKCSEITPYNFPKDMVPECLDASGKVVKR